MTNVDEQIHQLIKRAIDSPVNSSDRTKAILSLITMTDQYFGDQIKHKLLPEQLPDYDQAIKKVEANLNKDIQKFLGTYKLDIANHSATKIRQKFLNHFTKLISCRCIDIYRARKKTPAPISLDSPIAQDSSTSIIDTIADPKSQDLLHIKIEQDQQQRKIALRKYLEQDPNDELKSNYLRRSAYDPITQERYSVYILVKRHLFKQPPDTFKKIQTDFQISGTVGGTVANDWRRTVLPLLREIATRFGFTKEDI